MTEIVIMKAGNIFSLMTIPIHVVGVGGTQIQEPAKNYAQNSFHSLAFWEETYRTRIWRPRAGKIVCDYMYHVDFYHVHLFFSQQNFKN